MNNEEKILAILEQMQGDIASLKQGQATLEQGPRRIACWNERYARRNERPL